MTAFNMMSDFYLIGNEKGVLKVFDMEFNLVKILKVFSTDFKKILFLTDIIICISNNQIFTLKPNENFRGIFLYNIEETQICSYYLENYYLYLGLNNGHIKVIKIKYFD